VARAGGSPNVFRTPDERFAGLADYPFRPCYQYWRGLRMHFVDEGDGAPILLLHGEPTWSYMYRSMIPPLVQAGFRCIAPDYIGFGKSDKVLDDGWYVIERHVESIRSLIEALDLRGATLVVHDWGGPIGLRQVVDMPERWSRLVILNTWLHHHGFRYTDTIRRWRDYALRFAPGTGDMPTGDIVARWPRIDERRRSAVKAAYDAPYPDATSKAGARRFPWCLPFAEPVAGNAADQARCFEALRQWRRPAHFIFGDRDEIFTGDWARAWATEIPGATVDLVPGPHHVPEESGREIAARMLRYLAASGGP
jgi:haloalkane dehalogenase